MIKNGIYSTDPFSFSMAKYPFVDHEWLTHIGIAAVYKVTSSTIILIIIFSLIAVFSLCRSTSSKTEGKDEGWLIPAVFFLAGSALFSYSGIRPQVWGWLLLILWVSELRKGKRVKLFTLLFLQLLWVNTHGSFFLGIATYFLYLFSQLIQKKDIGRDLGKFLLLCSSTFLNPYGWRMWGEVWMSLSDIELRWRIQEWQPGLFTLNIPFIIYCALFFSLFVRYWKKISLFNQIISLSFFFLSLSAIRNIPLFLIVSLPVFIQTWEYLEADVHQCMKKSFIKLKLILSILCFFVGFFHMGYDISLIRPLSSTYPVDAVKFMIKNTLEGKIFADYSWGGYIIWKTPQLKTFIDGRMPSWKWKQNDPTQSNDAAQEYFNISWNHPTFEPYRKKYDIEYALIKKGDKKNIFMGYKKIYEDKLCILYRLH